MRRSGTKHRQARIAGQPDLFSVPAQVSNDRGPSSSAAAVIERPRKPKSPPAVARPPNGLLRVREAAARLGLSKSTLDKMRCDGRGPRFVKVTSKIVGYDPADLDAYAEARKRQSTSEV
jgi:predicted DNA-binding transcriptional regulator AlpA